MVSLVSQNEPSMSKDIAAPACVVLAGGLSPSPLARDTGLSVLDLWAGNDVGTVAQSWAKAFGRGIGGDARVLCLYGDPVPAPGLEQVEFDRLDDASPYRGPAGALSDARARIDADEIVVVEGARLLSSGIGRLIEHHRQSEALVTVARDPQGSPAGVYAIRAEALDEVPPRGFMDLKEQWLNKLLAAGKRVVVHEIAGRSLLLKTREDFLDAVLQLAGKRSAGENRLVCDSRTLHGFGSHRSEVAADARVEPGAVVVDSVVMPGAVVQAGSVVVRSLVGPRALVETGTRLVDGCVFERGVSPQNG